LWPGVVRLGWLVGVDCTPYGLALGCGIIAGAEIAIAEIEFFLYK